MALFPKLAAKPHKGLSTCYGQLGSNGAPSRGGHRWVEPSPTIFPKSHFVIPGQGASAEEGTGAGGWPSRRGIQRGTQRGTQTGTDTGECKFLRPRKRLRGHSLGTKVPEAGGLCITALSVPSTCSASAAESPRSLRAVAAEANGSTMAPLARVRPGFLPRPLPPALFTSTISRSAQQGGGFEGREEEEGGNIGLWRKSLTPFPLLSLPLRPDGLQSHILKAKQKTKTQRLTCLKSMKANCSVSPWNPGTGPDLANSVGKKRG